MSMRPRTTSGRSSAGPSCRIAAEKIPTERARRRRTILHDHLALALEGRLDHVFGYHCILTTLEVGDPEKLAEVEWWHRHRTESRALNKGRQFAGLGRGGEPGLRGVPRAHPVSHAGVETSLSLTAVRVHGGDTADAGGEVA